ncbi:hypothetical protein OS493_003494 [Desmophyllum pertusum]|uniref:Uncharacterized protein n=1 Tax=Desmophyllum pertusum TaxID=174260 RepID=A0A9X0A5J7_9CNID|nr:hypothetical protein OS493_003494 [Desmophyllum pertusum]
MAITKCQQLQALDFSECIHLLHPTVFCCIKEKATNLVSLSLENSEVVSDDIVQVALMCCPGLKHLNLSLCKNITDAAFALENTVSRTASASHTLQPGHNLTSVDISGCQSLSTMAVKYLVDICGANLTNVNLAWTGMNCTALLYLAGLNVANVARLMHEADHASVDSALPSMVAKEELPNHDNWCDGIHDFTNQGFSDSNLTGVVPLMPAGNTYGFNDSQLNEMEVLTLKDVLDHVLVTCEPAKSQSSEGIPCLQELDESRDEVLKSDNFLLTCSLLSVEATHNPISQQENSSHEHLLQTEQKETCVHGHGDCTCVMKKAADRTLCWNAPTGDEPLKESRTKINTQDESITSGLDETASDKREHDIEHNHTKTTVQKCNGGFEVEEIHEDEFDTESHPVSKTGDQFISCTQEKSCLKSECNNLSMPCTEVNGKKPEFPTIVCEEVKDDESTCNCRSIHGAAVKCEKSDHPFVSSAAVKCEKSDHPIVPSAGVECEKSDHSIVPSAGVECKKSDHPIVPSAGVECEKCVCPIMPCVELQVMDEEVECEDPRIHCRVDEGGETCFPNHTFCKRNGP